MSSTFLELLSNIFSLIKTPSLLYDCIQPRVVAEGTWYLESEHLGWRRRSAPLAGWPWARHLAGIPFPSLFFCPPIPNLLGDLLKSFILDTFLKLQHLHTSLLCSYCCLLSLFIVRE